MHTLLTRAAQLFALAAGVIACAVAGLTVASIAGRNLWARPLPGDVELTQFGIAACVSLCLPWCQLQRSNIIVDFFTSRASPRMQRGLDRMGALLLAGMTGLLAWRAAVGALSVREAGETSMILSLPMWWVYAMLAPGFALTALVALHQAFARDTAKGDDGAPVERPVHVAGEPMPSGPDGPAQAPRGTLVQGDRR